jgi:hypothetical protein
VNLNEQMEKNIEYFAKVLGNQPIETRFASAAKDRQRAIQRIHWNRKEGQWFDAWLSPNHCSLSETDNRTVRLGNHFQFLLLRRVIEKTDSLKRPLDITLELPTRLHGTIS